MTIHQDELQVGLDVLREDMDAFVAGGDFDSAFAKAIAVEVPPESGIPFHGMLIAVAAAAALAIVAGDFLPSWADFGAPASMVPGLDSDDFSSFDLVDDAMSLDEDDLVLAEWVELGAELKQVALAFDEDDPAAFEVWIAVIRVAGITGDLEQRRLAVEEATQLAESDAGLLELLDSPHLREEIGGDLWISIYVENPIGATVQVGDERIYGTDATLQLERGKVPVRVSIDDLTCGDVSPDDRLDIRTEEGTVSVDEGRISVKCVSKESPKRRIYVEPDLPKVPDHVRTRPIRVENAPEDIKPDPVAEADIEEEEVADEVLSPCGDLVAMEPSALMGRLTAEQIGCLQSEMTAGAQTKRDRVSRMLLLNTWGLGDMDAWWKLAENHLDQFAADAELTYLYAHYLGRKGQNRDAIYWAEKGLNLRRNWVGDRHVQRVDRLMRLKAICAAKIWGDRSESYTAKPTATTAETLWAARNEAKVFSREWLDHATASGLDNSEAKMLCASAAATSDYCQ